MIKFSLGYLSGSILSAMLVIWLLQPKPQPVVIPTDQVDFTAGIKLGYVIANQGGNKDTISAAITAWHNGTIQTFLSTLDNDHPRNP